jgi:hypothetical protein
MPHAVRSSALDYISQYIPLISPNYAVIVRILHPSSYLKFTIADEPVIIILIVIRDFEFKDQNSMCKGF